MRSNAGTLQQQGSAGGCPTAPFHTFPPFGDPAPRACAAAAGTPVFRWLVVGRQESRVVCGEGGKTPARVRLRLGWGPARCSGFHPFLPLPRHTGNGSHDQRRGHSGATGGPTCKLRDAITAANTDTATGGCSAGRNRAHVVVPPNNASPWRWPATPRLRRTICLRSTRP